MKANAKMIVSPRSLATGGWFSRLLEAVLDAQERRAEERAIRRSIRNSSSRLDDHILKDMGLSRNSIASAVRARVEAERHGRFGW